jgi:hypothetical protein
MARAISLRSTDVSDRTNWGDKLPLPFWIFMVFLVIIFFLSEHDIYQSKKWQEQGLLKPEEIAAGMERGGGIFRRIAPLSLGWLFVFSPPRKGRNGFLIKGVI